VKKLNFERELIISILKFTKKQSVSRQLLQKHTKISDILIEKLLGKYEKIGFIYQRRDFVEAKRTQRIALAIHALKLGADLENVCRLLDWDEFEQVAFLALKASGYEVKKNFRFKWNNRKWEIDVLGLKKPLIICVDCKQWSHGWQRAATIKAVEAQIERAKAFTESLELHIRYIPQISEWQRILIVPIVISLVPAPFKFYKTVPIVPVLKLQHFLNELPAHIHEIKTFRGKLKRETQ
jgi:Holliday junction resolvase-like predicted endonuclease